MGVPYFFLTLWENPVNTISIVFMLGLFFYLWNYRYTGDLLCINYTNVVVDGQWWRIFTATYTHLQFFHIAFNMYGLYLVAWIENVVSSLEYVRLTFLLLMGSEFFYLFLAWAYRRFLHRDTLIQQRAVGYSGVLFGWMAYIVLAGYGNPSLFGLNIPGWIIPWIYLIITQLVVPRASFVGHLAGLLIGHIMAFGVFDWFDYYLLAVSMFWTIIAVIYSLKITNTMEMTWIQSIEASERELTVVNGEIIYMDNDRDSHGSSASSDELI